MPVARSVRQQLFAAVKVFRRLRLLQEGEGAAQVLEGPRAVQGGGLVLLAQFLSLAVGNHRQVTVLRCREIEQALEEQLSWRGVQEVGTAHNPGNTLGRVIDDHGELVGIQPMLALDDKVREFEPSEQIDGGFKIRQDFSFEIKEKNRTFPGGIREVDNT